MFVFGEVTDWEGDPSVKQVLVFPSWLAKDNFIVEYNRKDRPRTMDGYPNENGIGAMYKLRAVRNHDGTWSSVIRCGFTAIEIGSIPEKFEDYTSALRMSKMILLERVIKSFV